MTDEERRIHSYLTAQAAKLPPAAIVEKVQAAMAELDTAAAAVPPARFGQRPSPDEWSASEVMAHVVSAGAHFGGGILAILEDRSPAERGQGAACEDAATRTFHEWRDILSRDRDALFARVLASEPTARLDRAIEHPMFGPLNWREALLFMRLHDLDHAGQLKRIAAALA